MDNLQLKVLAVGIVGTQAIVNLLKSTIKEDRPQASGTYGMPSSRAATTLFIFTYVLLISKKVVPSTLIVMGGAALMTCFSKYYAGRHSPRQLVAGSALGAVLGLAATRLTGWLRKV
jgi:membrane-associated phospholipid phosphatase